MNLEVEAYEGELRKLRKALAQPPCQTGSQCIGGKCPECEWVGLTHEEIEAFKQSCHLGGVGYDTFIKRFATGIEAKLKEKNT